MIGVPSGHHTMFVKAAPVGATTISACENSSTWETIKSPFKSSNFEAYMN